LIIWQWLTFLGHPVFYRYIQHGRSTAYPYN